MKLHSYKNVNNCLNTHNYYYLRDIQVKVLISIYFLFMFSATVLVRHLRQHKTVVFLHQCLIHAVLLSLFNRNNGGTFFFVIWHIYRNQKLKLSGDACLIQLSGMSVYPCHLFLTFLLSIFRGRNRERRAPVGRRAEEVFRHYGQD